MHDPLTLLPNREAFAMRLHEWLQECSAAQRLPAEALQQGESALQHSDNTAVATVEEAQEAEEEAERSEEHTSELQSHSDLVCRLLLEKKKRNRTRNAN